MEPLIVTTSYRGVFFGYGDYSKATESTFVLKNARICVYWPEETHGVLGLAQEGPSVKARISPAAPEITLQGVTGVIRVTSQAAEAWEKEPWG